MNLLSALIRIIMGVVVIIFAISTYKQNSAHIAAGESPRLFGQAIGFSGTPLTLIFVFFGLFGLALIIMGLARLLLRK